MRTIVSVDQMGGHHIVVVLSDGTIMQFHSEELAMMASYQTSSRDEKLQGLPIHRIQ